MKTFKHLKNKGLIFFLGLIMTACSSSDNNTGDCITQDDINRFQSKTEAFSANPTKANCESVKAAVFDYLNKLKNCSEATEATITWIEQWRDIDCSGFNSDGGNNTGGGGTGNKEKRDVTFWTSEPKMVGVSVYVKGSFAGTFTKYITGVETIKGDKDPNAIYIPFFCGSMCVPCYLPGMVTIHALEVGTHTYSTSDGRSGTFTVFPKNPPYDTAACNTHPITNYVW
ncbi:hypothetical protein [Myroides sp. DW712]|uniref:hypothetical protein n=1 Tax=Myroides sp. DW712 TaxID=3389800 RepID=UPI00397E8FEE